MGILGTLLTSATFIEPFINPIIQTLFKEVIIIKKIDIYNQVIEQILTADEVIRFKTPTTSWGAYSEGLKIFEQTIAAIQTAKSRGVQVRIIADIWDWERAKFAEALIRAGAVVKYQKTIHDYYLIKDQSLLLGMGTDTRSKNVHFLDRKVRPLRETATVNLKQIHIETALLRFDEEWNRIKDHEIDEIIKSYLEIKCPYTDKIVKVEFKNSRIELTPLES